MTAYAKYARTLDNQLDPPEYDEPEDREVWDTPEGIKALDMLRRAIAEADSIGLLGLADAIEEVTDGYQGHGCPRIGEGFSSSRRRIRHKGWKLGRLAREEDDS